MSANTRQKKTNKGERMMKVKELIKLLKQAPQDIDVDVYNHDTDYLQKIGNVWIPGKEDMKDNPEVQLEINKGE